MARSWILCRFLLLQIAMENLMPEDTDQVDWVDLADAIEALRSALMAVWNASPKKGVRFRVEPVELTVQAGVTRSGKGAAGVRWHLLSLGGERAKQTTAIQTLRLRLSPVFIDAHGNLREHDEQLIWDQESAIRDGADSTFSGEPE
jgi:hypothetical protein